MFWKRRTPPQTPPVPQPHAGFFSTDTVPEHDKKRQLQRAMDALECSIQRTAKDFKVITRHNGGGETVAAMDSSPNLQFPKNSEINGSAFGLPPSQIEWYANQAFIGYQVAAILMQNWLVDKACTMPARDAARHGYHITVNDGTDVEPEVMDFMRERDKAFGVKQNMVEYVRFGRGFGIRHALFEVESADPLYYEKPFNIDGVTPGSYKGISQIDPYWITPLLDAQAAANPASKHFYEPTWWMINGRRIHRTHLCIMRNGDEMADILKPTYYYGGVSIPQKIAERVFAAERTANEAPMLALTKRLITLKTDITAALANYPAFIQKMIQWTGIMSNFGIKVVGEDEEVNTHDTALTDLDAVIMTQYQIVAAAAEVPATKLLGTSPKGFGAAGEYEIESYHELLEAIQEHDLAPLVNRHHALLIKSEVMKKFPNQKFFRTEATFKPTDTPTHKEAAEIRLLDAQADVQLVQAGAIDGFDVRQRLINDPDSTYNGLPDVVPDGPGDREAQQEAEAALEQPVTAKNKAKEEGKQ